MAKKIKANKQYYKELYKEYLILEAILAKSSKMKVIVDFANGEYDETFDTFTAENYRTLERFAKDCLDPLYVSMLKNNYNVK